MRDEWAYHYDGLANLVDDRSGVHGRNYKPQLRQDNGALLELSQICDAAAIPHSFVLAMAL
jgi:hypothetical protein